MTMPRAIALLGLSLLIAACSDPPPPGKDLVNVSCTCFDGCAGGGLLPITGSVCTDASVPANLTQAQQFLCDGKETTGFLVCKIENCSPNSFNVFSRGCPENNGDFSTGDFGQSSAIAVAPSNVTISGDDINDFSIVPETFTVSTTQTGSSLFFGSIAATLATTVFTSDGIFGDDEHTLAEGQLLGAPFSVALQPDGSFLLPPGTGNFIITGVIDGDRLSLTVTSIDLGGQYDEDLGIFTMVGTVQAQGADLTIDADLVFQFTNRPPRARAGADQVLECDSTQHTAAVHLSGEQSTDPDGDDDIALFTWYLDGAQVATGEQIDQSIVLGQHLATLVVADQQGSFGGDTTLVEVRDTLAPLVTCPDELRVEADPTTCIGALPDIRPQTSISDVCTPADGFTVVQDPPGGTALPVGQHVVEIEATDTQGLTSVPCPTLVTVSLPIVRNPDLVRYLDAQLGDDFLRVHGRVSPCVPLDPSLTDFEVTLSNALGDIYQAVLPVGAIQKRGKFRWFYRDRTASIRHDGIRDLRITYVPARDRYEIRLHTFGDLSLATEVRMTLELRFGGSFFATTNDWTPDGYGWRVKDF